MPDEWVSETECFDWFQAYVKRVHTQAWEDGEAHGDVHCSLAAHVYVWWMRRDEGTEHVMGRMKKKKMLLLLLMMLMRKRMRMKARKQPVGNERVNWKDDVNRCSDVWVDAPMFLEKMRTKMRMKRKRKAKTE